MSDRSTEIPRVRLRWAAKVEGGKDYRLYGENRLQVVQQLRRDGVTGLADISPAGSWHPYTGLDIPAWDGATRSGRDA